MKGLEYRDISKTSSGFTLMELLISISVIMAIMTIVGSVFKLGADAVDKGDSKSDEQRRFMTAVNYITRQLEAVHLSETAVFQGTKDQIKFHSVVNKGTEEYPKEIICRLVKDDETGDMELEISQKTPLPLTANEKDEEVITLLSGIRDFSLAYLQRTVKGSEWVDEWKDDLHLPIAVKVEFVYSKWPAQIFIRILREKRKV